MARCYRSKATWAVSDASRSRILATRRRSSVEAIEKNSPRKKRWSQVTKNAIYHDDSYCYIALTPVL